MALQCPLPSFAPQVEELEVNVLQALEWRRGPFFDLSPNGGF